MGEAIVAPTDVLMNYQFNLLKQIVIFHVRRYDQCPERLKDLSAILTGCKGNHKNHSGEKQKKPWSQPNPNNQVLIRLSPWKLSILLRFLLPTRQGSERYSTAKDYCSIAEVKRVFINELSRHLQKHRGQISRAFQTPEPTA